MKKNCFTSVNSGRLRKLLDMLTRKREWEINNVIIKKRIDLNLFRLIFVSEIYAIFQNMLYSIFPGSR